MSDMVHHPAHYQGADGRECIDVIRERLGHAGFVAYCVGNAIKYRFRAGRKGEAAEDLAKASVYERWAEAGEPVRDPPREGMETEDEQRRRFA